METSNIDTAQIINNDTISIQSENIKSVYGEISFGSKKAQKNKIKLQIGTSKENNSMDSNDIKNITKLEDIDNYTKKQLDNIARVFNISNFYKEGQKRILYKKEELYSKIREFIESK
jgi:hypothetical protein